MIMFYTTVLQLVNVMVILQIQLIQVIVKLSDLHLCLRSLAVLSELTECMLAEHFNQVYLDQKLAHINPRFVFQWFFCLCSQKLNSNNILLLCI